jgi:hypothetical protein
MVLTIITFGENEATGELRKAKHKIKFGQALKKLSLDRH